MKSHGTNSHATSVRTEPTFTQQSREVRASLRPNRHRPAIASHVAVTPNKKPDSCVVENHRHVPANIPPTLPS